MLQNLFLINRATIAREIANGKTTLHIIRLLHRDHRRSENSQTIPTKREEDLIKFFLELSIDRSLHLLSDQCQGRQFQQVEQFLGMLEWLYHSGQVVARFWRQPRSKHVLETWFSECCFFHILSKWVVVVTVFASATYKNPILVLRSTVNCHYECIHFRQIFYCMKKDAIADREH